MDHLVVNFVTWLDKLHSNIAIWNIWVSDALNIATLDFVKWNILVVLSVIILEQAINEFFTCFGSKLTLLKVAIEE